MFFADQTNLTLANFGNLGFLETRAVSQTKRAGKMLDNPIYQNDKPEHMTDDLDQFNQLLEKLQRERVWVDEKYALPVEVDLLDRFIRGETSQITSEFVLAQISGFRSWNEAFLQALEKAAKDEDW